MIVMYKRRTISLKYSGLPSCSIMSKRLGPTPEPNSLDSGSDSASVTRVNLEMHLTSLCLSFLISKMRLIIVFHRVVWVWWADACYVLDPLL